MSAAVLRQPEDGEIRERIKELVRAALKAA